MHQLKKMFLATILAFSIVSVSACASNIKESFKADDFGMGYLAPEAKISTEIDNLFKNFVDVKGKIPKEIKTPVTDGIIDDVEKVLKQKIVSVITNNAQPLIKFLDGYNIFKTEPVEYPQLKEDKEISDTIKTANALLKKVYRLKGSVVVSKKFIEKANQDVLSFKENKDPVKVAGVGIVTVSIVNNSISAFSSTQTLLKELEDFKNLLQTNIQKNPTLALKLSGVVGEMATATKELGTVTADVPQLLESANKLIGSIKD